MKSSDWKKLCLLRASGVARDVVLQAGQFVLCDVVHLAKLALFVDAAFEVGFERLCIERSLLVDVLHALARRAEDPEEVPTVDR